MFAKIRLKLDWHQVYFVLAFIDILTICAALFLSQQLMSIYQDSVAENKKMSVVVNEFIKLGYIAKEMNQPANRVFESHNVEYESEALRQSKIWFDTAFKHAIRKFEQTFNQQAVDEISPEVEQIAVYINKSEKLALKVFDYYAVGDIKTAGIYMAQMDESYYKVTEAIGNISHNLSEQQNAHFQQQISNAEKLKIYELIISAAVLAIVCLVAFYGYLMNKRLKSDRLKLVNALATAEQSAKSKQQFLANMSHEIRTPMNAITNMLSFIDTAVLSEDERQYLNLALVSTNNLRVIVNDILDISKIEQGKLVLEERDFNLVQVVSEQVNLYQKTPTNTQVRMEYKNDLPEQLMVKGDSVRFIQVLNNLLNNALKFTHKGHIRVRASISNHLDNQILVSISVEDSGIGIPQAQLQHIFEAFVQSDASTNRKYGGTGLGLAISKSLCEQMGGDLTVVSQVDVGSTFTATFNFFKSDIVENKPESEVQIQSLGLHLLVAEDHEINTIVITSLLDRLGCSYVTVENGLLCIEALKRTDFDAVLMDCFMPELDGYETSKKIRQGACGEDKRDIPIVAVTANSMQEDLLKCQQAGMDEHVAKPINISDLYTVLSKWGSKCV